MEIYSQDRLDCLCLRCQGTCFGNRRHDWLGRHFSLNVTGTTAMISTCSYGVIQTF